MKKIAIKFSAVVLMVACLSSCNKKQNEPPAVDEEFQSSIDASAGVMIASDIDMMIAQASESAGMLFYGHVSGSGSNTVSVLRDTLTKINTLTFNNARCVDGKIRNGKIIINYQGVPASGYIRNPGHVSNLTFVDYSVNKYKLKNQSTFKVTNTTVAGYSISVTKLTWKLEGELLVRDTTEGSGSKDFSWKGPITKTLANSTTSTVHPSTSLPIVWTTTNNAIKSTAVNAIVEYSGEFSGTVLGGEAYTFKIEADAPLTRNFGCSPDYYINAQHHPFVKGKAVFKTGGEDKSKRYLFFGSETNDADCNNSGIIKINGVSYNYDFVQ